MPKIFLIFILSLLMGCGVENSGTSQSNQNNLYQILEADPIELSENARAKSALRIVALGNGSAEILSALGLVENIVGRDIASTTLSLKDVPIVSNGHDLSAEKVLALKPDLVLTDPNTSPKSAINQIIRSKVKVVEIPESYTLAGINKKVLAISKALRIESSGSLLEKKITKSFRLNQDPSGKSVLFLYLRGSNGIFLVGGKGSGADEVIAAAGAIDIGTSQYKNPFTPINSEAILNLKPDFYLLMSAGLDSVGGIDQFRALPGIDPKAPVIAVDDSLLLSFGTRTPDLIKKIRVILNG
jgi:iron complex transport system substrate-binding protein